jgi:hypothetical protein
MNLDATSFALAHISYTIKTLSKSNFKTSVAEISNVIFCFVFHHRDFVFSAHIGIWIRSWTTFLSNSNHISWFTIDRWKSFSIKTFRKYLFKLLVTRNSDLNIKTEFFNINLLCFRYCDNTKSKESQELIERNIFSCLVYKTSITTEWIFNIIM